MSEKIASAAKSVLDVSRKQEIDDDGKIVKLPCYISTDLMQALALNTTSNIKLITPIKDELISVDDYEYELIRQLSIAGISCVRIYIIPHLGFAKDGLANVLNDDARHNIESRVLVMSDLPFTSESFHSNKRWIIDDTALVDFGDDRASSSQCVVTIREADVSAALDQWGELWRSSDADVYENNDLDLQEPLVLSADLINGTASVLCTHDHVDNVQCSWYHGAWQYLRLLDMVSTPTWHHAFYNDQLQEALSLYDTPRALITGTADYSVLAYLINAANKVQKICDINVVDLCATPLFACKWYAKKAGIDINVYEHDIFDYEDSHDSSTDLVVTDAFLTRFNSQDTMKIIGVWHKVLKSGGRVITTIRMHDVSPSARAEEDAIKDFQERALKRFDRWGPYLNISRDNISYLSETYARNMVSNRIGGENDIISAFEKSGFTILKKEIAHVPGELYPTVYLRLVCANN